jgi:hypothetical protein
MKAGPKYLLVVVALATGCSVTPNPVVPDPKNITEPIEQANAVSSQVDLTQAMQVAMAWYAENGSFSGFTPEAAKAQEPSLTYNASPSAVAGQVSIRVVSPTAVVLATVDPSGAASCSAYDASTGAATNGSTDAGTVEDCV